MSYEAGGVANGVSSGSACGSRGGVGTKEGVPDGDVARCEIYK